MPAYANETALVKKALDIIRKAGGQAQKIHGSEFQRKGEPDIDAVIRGRALKLEAKQPGKRPTTIQFKRMRDWAAVGALVGWFTTTEELEQLLTHVDEPAWVNPQLTEQAAFPNVVEVGTLIGGSPSNGP